MQDLREKSVEFEEEVADSIERINRWLEMKKRDSMSHPSLIHTYMFSDEPAELLVFDILNVVESASRYIDLCK